MHQWWGGIPALASLPVKNEQGGGGGEGAGEATYILLDMFTKKEPGIRCGDTGL